MMESQYKWGGTKSTAERNLGYKWASLGDDAINENAAPEQGPCPNSKLYEMCSSPSRVCKTTCSKERQDGLGHHEHSRASRPLVEE